MSGLLSSAYPWAPSENDDNKNKNHNQNTKKRTPSLSISRNKTVKKTPMLEDPASYSTNDFPAYNSDNHYSMEDIQANNQIRNARVQEIIHNMNTVNLDDAGQGLASFAPLPLFSESKPESPQKSFASLDYYPMGAMKSNQPTESPLGNTNYYHAYSEKSKIGNVPDYSMHRIISGGPVKNITNNPTSSSLDRTHDKIMEKLNKMMYILEEQQNEPTKHITEEFILYTFLGVFIIFIVDSFSRHGKYVR